MSCEDFTKYRIFLHSFANSRDETWNIKYGSYTVEEYEIVAEAINWTLQYLIEGRCPSSLVTPIVKNIASEIQNKDRKSPTIDEFDFNSNKYKASDIKRLVFELLREYCSNLTNNVELNKLLTLRDDSNDFSSTYSIASIKNTRRTMEDRYICIDDFNGMYNVQNVHQKVHFYAVFDGHDGYNAACYGASHLPFNIAKDSAYPSNIVEALRRSFITTDHNFVKKNIKSGTTALCALHYPQESKLYIAWVGDSKALLVKKENMLQLVIPHKPNIKEEAERIINQGGSIMPWRGTLRVKGLLNLSRALGDVCCKPFVISDPDIKCIELDNEEDFLILASDGLWDHLSEEEAARAVYDHIKIKDENSVANHLIELAKKRGSSDNITVIVIFLKEPSLINKSSNNKSTTAISKTIMDTFSNRYTGDFNLDNSTQNLVPNANTEIDIKTDLGKDIFQKDTLFNDGLNNFVDPQQNTNDTNNPFMTTTTTITAATTNFDTNNDIILEDKNNIDMSPFIGSEFDDNDRHHHHHLNNQYQNQQDHHNHHNIIDDNELQKFNNDDKLSEMDMGPETSVDITDDVMMMATESSETTDLLEHSALSHSKETLPSSDNMNPFDIKNSLHDFGGTVEEVENLEELSNRTSPYGDTSPVPEVMTAIITTEIETKSSGTEHLIRNDDEDNVNDNNIEYKINDEINNVEAVDMLTDKFDSMIINENNGNQELFENECEKETVIEKDEKETIIEKDEKETIIEKDEKETVIEKDEKETVTEKDEKEEIQEKHDDENNEEKVTVELQDNQFIKSDITENFGGDIMDMNKENHAVENNEYHYGDHDYTINNNENIDDNDLNDYNNKENEYFSDRDNDFVTERVKINAEMISIDNNTEKIDNDNLSSSIHDNRSFDENNISSLNDGDNNIQKEENIHITDSIDEIRDSGENLNKFELDENNKKNTIEILGEQIVNSEKLQSFGTVTDDYVDEINMEQQQQQDQQEQEQEQHQLLLQEDQQQQFVLDENTPTSGDLKSVPEGDEKISENLTLTTGGTIIGDSCDESEDEWKYMKLKEGEGEKNTLIHQNEDLLQSSSSSSIHNTDTIAVDILTPISTIQTENNYTKNFDNNQHLNLIEEEKEIEQKEFVTSVSPLPPQITTTFEEEYKSEEFKITENKKEFEDLSTAAINSLNIDSNEKDEINNKITEDQIIEKETFEDMSKQLNPDAKEFVPSATSPITVMDNDKTENDEAKKDETMKDEIMKDETIKGETIKDETMKDETNNDVDGDKITDEITIENAKNVVSPLMFGVANNQHFSNDDIVAQSPRKGAINMEDISIPDEKVFQHEIHHRPADPSPVLPTNEVNEMMHKDIDEMLNSKEAMHADEKDNEKVNSSLSDELVVPIIDNTIMEESIYVENKIKPEEAVFDSGKEDEVAKKMLTSQVEEDIQKELNNELSAKSSESTNSKNQTLTLVRCASPIMVEEKTVLDQAPHRPDNESEDMTAVEKATEKKKHSLTEKIEHDKSLKGQKRNDQNKVPAEGKKLSKTSDVTKKPSSTQATTKSITRPLPNRPQTTRTYPLRPSPIHTQPTLSKSARPKVTSAVAKTTLTKPKPEGSTTDVKVTDTAAATTTAKRTTVTNKTKPTVQPTKQPKTTTTTTKSLPTSKSGTTIKSVPTKAPASTVAPKITDKGTISSTKSSIGISQRSALTATKAKPSTIPKETLTSNLRKTEVQKTPATTVNAEKTKTQTSAQKLIKSPQGGITKKSPATTTARKSDGHFTGQVSRPKTFPLATKKPVTAKKSTNKPNLASKTDDVAIKSPAKTTEPATNKNDDKPKLNGSATNDL